MNATFTSKPKILSSTSPNFFLATLILTTIAIGLTNYFILGKEQYENN